LLDWRQSPTVFYPARYLHHAMGSMAAHHRDSPMATSMKAFENPTDSVEAAAGPPSQDERTALTKEAFKRAFLDNLFYVQGKFPALATRNDYYQALAYAVRDRLLQRWSSTAWAR